MIMRDGGFSNMIQHQEEDEAQKLMEKEQQVMTSMLTGNALAIVQRVLYLNHFLQSSIPQNLGVPSKVITLAVVSIFSSRIVYSLYKQYLEFPVKCHCGRRIALHNLVIARYGLYQ